jgi:hypothetical protein
MNGSGFLDTAKDFGFGDQIHQEHPIMSIQL